MVVPPAGTDHATVGTAVGYLLSTYLREDALENTVVRSGAEQLHRAIRAPTRDPRDIEREVVARVAELAPWHRPLDAGEWEGLCELCGILPRLEQYFRAGFNVLTFLAEPLREHGRHLGALATAFASPRRTAAR